jgi:hypothetical protein
MTMSKKMIDRSNLDQRIADIVDKEMKAREWEISAKEWFNEWIRLYDQILVEMSQPREV